MKNEQMSLFPMQDLGQAMMTARDLTRGRLRLRGVVG